MNPIWIGMFTVTGPRKNPMLAGNVGACLWIAAQAEDEQKLRLRATNAMKDLGLMVTEAEDMQEVENELDLSEEQAKLIPEARQNIDSVVCGTWHFFKHHDA